MFRNLFKDLLKVSDSNSEDVDEAIRQTTRTPYGFKLPNDIRLEVFKGDLTKFEVGIIVNSTNSRLILAAGKVSPALLGKAGKEMQDECEDQVPLKEGDIAITNGYGLDCSVVLHINCPSWEGGKTEKMLKAYLLKCLTWANDLSEESIAFPAIGTGALGYPPEVVAKCFLQVSTDYAKANPRSRIKQIMIVAFTDDAGTINGYEKAFGMKLTVQQHEAKRSKTAVECKSKMENLYAPPSNWVTPAYTYREFALAKDGKEWKEVEANFQRSLSTTATVLQILRVQNPMSHTLYEVTKLSLAFKLNKSEKEVETRPLWHGTSASNVHKITRTKFDRGLARADSENKLGTGSYFATTTNYSAGDRFSLANDAGERFMIQAKVLTGEYCKGERAFKQAPHKNGYEQYDSVVDDVSNPIMFAVFHDASAYPEYIIKYKLPGQDCAERCSS